MGINNLKLTVHIMTALYDIGGKALLGNLDMAHSY